MFFSQVFSYLMSLAIMSEEGEPKLGTAPVDPRFPNQNQTRLCLFRLCCWFWSLTCCCFLGTATRAMSISTAAGRSRERTMSLAATSRRCSIQFAPMLGLKGGTPRLMRVVSQAEFERDCV